MGRWKNPYRERLEEEHYALLVNEPGPGWSPEFIAPFLNEIKKFKQCYFEFGSGSGQHLIAQAQAAPERFFIGAEIRYKRAYRTAQKATQANLTNILIFRGEGLSLLKSLGKCLLDGIYILFPDPWDKRKWYKNRILQLENLNVFSQVLKPAGFLHYRTDHPEYYESAVKLFKASPKWNFQFMTRDFKNSTHPETLIKSEFEMLFQSQQMNIHALQISKKTE